MKVTKKLVIAAAAIPMVFATASAYAFGGKGGYDMGRHGGKHDFDRGIIKQLDLTEEQQNQLEELREARRAEREANRDTLRAERMAEMQSQRLAMQELVLAPEFNEEAARQLAQAMIEKQTERRVQRLAAKHEMLSILTDEQKEEYKTLMEERFEKMSEKMEKRMGKGKSN